jgi:hypothetical protein
MAKKKAANKNKGINLLKGITGSQLAKMIAIIVILLAIPLTINSVRNQTNTQQNAATNYCQQMGGSCIDTNFQNNVTRCTSSGKKIVGGLCPGAANIQCCINPANITTTTTKRTCTSIKGTCLDLNKYWCTVSVGGLCNGGSNIKCCTGNYGKK